MFMAIVDRVLPFLKRDKQQGKVCPNGHVMHPSWDVCPYCLEMQQAMGLSGTPGGVPLPSAAQGTAMVSLSDLGKSAKDAKKGEVCGWLVALNGQHKGEDFRLRVGKVISEATKRRIPIHAVGHSELEQDSLPALGQIARRTGGTYKAAPTVEDVNKGLTVIKDYINKAYVIDWKTDLDHDGKEHKVEIAMESDSGPGLKGSLMVRTPDYFDWIRLAAWTVGILLLVIVGVAIYVLTRPKPPPQRFCFVCKRAQMPEWDVCLFCLKSAKARLLIQKGMNKGKQYPLVGKVVSLGSGPENNIRILDGTVSGKHAGVSIDDNKFEIVDLGSKNGVLVNGKKTPRRFLRNGDVITLGMTELKFESSIAAAAEEADD